MRYLNIFLFTFLAAVISINAQTTFVASADSRNQATFESNAPLEDIVGVSNQIEAIAMIDINNLSSSINYYRRRISFWKAVYCSWNGC